MADLIEDVYSFQALANKYNNFMTPAYKITIASENVSSNSGAVISNVRLSLSMDAADTLEFRVTGSYNLEKGKFEFSFKDKLKLGKVVTVSLGYGSSLTKVFKGYISKIAMEYGEEPSCIVSCMDVTALMREHKPNTAFVDKTVTEIFNEIMDQYKKICAAKDVITDAGSQDKATQYIQKASDYDFICTELCPAENKDFFVFGGKAYFKNTGWNTTASLKLEFGKSLLSFSGDRQYLDEMIQVTVVDKNDSSEKIKVEERVSAPASMMEKVLANPTVKEVSPSESGDADDANKYLKKAVNEEKKRLVNGAGQCIGLPELVPGRMIEIDGMDADVNGTYFLASVEHCVDDNGFITNFTLGDRSESFSSEIADSEAKQANQNSSKNKIQNGDTMRGKVVKNWDPDHPGMVSVQITRTEEGSNETTWLPVLVPYAGAGFGYYSLPEVGSQVLISNLSGDEKSQIVLGCLWDKTTTIPEATANEENTIKRWKTKGGIEIICEDEADKNKVTVQTSGGLNIVMEDEANQIQLADKEMENKILLDAKNGKIEIIAKDELSLTSGDVKLTLDGKQNKLSEEAKQVELKGSNSFNLDGQSLSISGQSLEISGNKASIKSQSNLEVEATGIAQIKGSMLKLN